jgi:hypothetical protein
MARRQWQVDVKLNSTAAVWPPLSEPTNNQLLRPIAILFISRSAALLSMEKKRCQEPFSLDGEAALGGGWRCRVGDDIAKAGRDCGGRGCQTCGGDSYRGGIS